MLKVNSMENVVPGWSSSLIATSFIGGIQFILLGVIGKYIEKYIWRRVQKKEKRNERKFVIKKNTA